jgi:hypothetical protein
VHKTCFWILRKIIVIVLFTIIVNVCPVKIQFIILFSTACFSLKGHDQVEHKIKRIYMHSLYGD